MVSWSWPTFHQTQLGTAWVFSGPLYQAILIGKVEPCFPVHDTDRAVILNWSSLQCSVCLLLHLFRNLQAAICSYYDIEQPAVELPSMTVVDDVTIGEGESVPPKTRFFKAWRIQNSGKPFLQLGHNIMTYVQWHWVIDKLFVFKVVTVTVTVSDILMINIWLVMEWWIYRFSVGIGFCRELGRQM